MAQRGESIASMKIASVVGSVQPLLARAGCLKMPWKFFRNRSRKPPARTTKRSKARVARAAPESRQQARSALAGDLSWGRLGRIALLQDTSEIFPKSLPEACRDLPELTLALLGLMSGLLGVIWGLLGVI